MRREIQTKITSKESEQPTLKTPDRLVEAWCSECGQLVNSVTAEAAAVLSDIPTGTIQNWIESGRIHSVKSEELLLICLNSLLR